MSLNPTPKPRTSRATWAILALIIIAVVLVTLGCQNRSSTPTRTDCPQDWQQSSGVGDAFTDGFQQGLNNCK